MKAVVLAAGEGERMHPLTYTKPKVMLPIANKPILEHLLIELKQAGFKDFILVVGYRGEMVRDYFGDGEKWGVKVEYVTQRRQLGTAHAVKTLEGFVEEEFLLVNGDIIVGAEEVRKILNKRPPSLGVVETEELGEMGVVEVEGGRVMRILEKSKAPPSNLANAGVYFLGEEIFDAVSRTGKSPRGEYELTDSLQLLIDDGYKICYQKLDRWLDVSYPWDLLTANEAFLKGLKSENLGVVEENAAIKGPVSIGRDTIIRAGSYIQGPVVIGESCDIGPNGYIRPSTSVGEGCHIGAAVEVKNSLIMKGTKMPHHNYVGDSIIGEGCNLGAGAKIANLRLDKQEVSIAGVDTKRRKLGAIIGDGVEIGINASINVGSVIGDNTFIGPGAVVTGVILPNSRIF
jgi:bifunctional UDP-N-acetylglucosamine pyrophosphorylase/glucosamine-1-phosphate N-acetyltransferase